MIDFIVDKHFFMLSLHHPQVQSRNRRAMGILAIVSGAFAGAFLHKAKGPELTILVALVFKIAILVALGLVTGEEREKVQDEEEKVGTGTGSSDSASAR